LDRRTDDPGESGGASPTVVTSRQDGDVPISDDGRDTRPAGVIMPSPLMPRTPSDTPAWNTPAIGSIAGENGKDGSGAAVTEAAAGDAPVGADALGSSALDSSAFDTPGFSFGSPDPTGLDSWATGPVSWSLGDTDESQADGALATGFPVRDEPDTSLSFEPPSFTASYTPVPALSESYAPQPSPDPPAVSAAAFTWETPEPPPTSPSSPARTFLRSAGNVKPPPPARPTVTVATPQPAPPPAPAQAPATVRRAPSKAAARRSVRQAHLTIARVEPWSVMKFSFVVSLVAFVILFVVVSVLWGSLSALGVFDSLQRVVSSVTSSQASNGVNAAKWFSASRILGWTALLGSLNIVLITAMSTIGAVVYNLTSRLVGGVEVTLRESE
jgi:hypothetical protein